MFLDLGRRAGGSRCCENVRPERVHFNRCRHSYIRKALSGIDGPCRNDVPVPGFQRDAVSGQAGVEFSGDAGCKVLAPESYVWPDFLKRSNLLAIVDRIVVIAVIAIGMTMVIITAGIDLSVGSLIALAAVISTLVMKKLGGLEASALAVVVGFLVGTLSCGIIGGFGGYIGSRFKVAPFITTLGIMMMARGLARRTSLRQVKMTSGSSRNPRSSHRRLTRKSRSNGRSSSRGSSAEGPLPRQAIVAGWPRRSPRESRVSN